MPSQSFRFHFLLFFPLFLMGNLILSPFLSSFSSNIIHFFSLVLLAAKNPFRPHPNTSVSFFGFLPFCLMVHSIHLHRQAENTDVFKSIPSVGISNLFLHGDFLCLRGMEGVAETEEKGRERGRIEKRCYGVLRFSEGRRRFCPYPLYIPVRFSLHHVCIPCDLPCQWQYQRKFHAWV